MLQASITMFTANGIEVCIAIGTASQLVNINESCGLFLHSRE